MSVSEEVALAQAARTGGLAPSIHNTQPWRWRVDGSTLDLRAERSRQLAVTDPVGRMLAISCGAALDHFVVAMRARGLGSWVRRFPDPQIPSLLASIRFQRPSTICHESPPSAPEAAPAGKASSNQTTLGELAPKLAVAKTRRRSGHSRL